MHGGEIKVEDDKPYSLVVVLENGARALNVSQGVLQSSEALPDANPTQTGSCPANIIGGGFEERARLGKGLPGIQVASDQSQCISPCHDAKRFDLQV